MKTIIAAMILVCMTWKLQGQELRELPRLQHGPSVLTSLLLGNSYSTGSSEQEVGWSAGVGYFGEWAIFANGSLVVNPQFQYRDYEVSVTDYLTSLFSGGTFFQRFRHSTIHIKDVNLAIPTHIHIYFFKKRRCYFQFGANTQIQFKNKYSVRSEINDITFPSMGSGTQASLGVDEKNETAHWLQVTPSVGVGYLFDKLQVSVILAQGKVDFRRSRQPIDFATLGLSVRYMLRELN